MLFLGAGLRWRKRGLKVRVQLSWPRQIAQEIKLQACQACLCKIKRKIRQSLTVTKMTAVARLKIPVKQVQGMPFQSGTID